MQLGSKNRSDRVGDFNLKYNKGESGLLEGMDGGLHRGGEIFGEVSGCAGPS